MNFSDRIKRLRERLNLTQSELARLLGVAHYDTVLRWERGHSEGIKGECTEKLIKFLEDAPDIAVPILSNIPPDDGASEPLADRFERIREKFDLSAEELARMLGISFQFYSKYKGRGAVRRDPSPCVRIMMFLLEQESLLVTPYLWPEILEQKSSWTPERIRNLRSTLNLYEEDLAGLLNVGHLRVVRGWERGANPSFCVKALLEVLERHGRTAADWIADTPLVENWPPERVNAIRSSMGLTVDQFALGLGMSNYNAGLWVYHGVSGGCPARLLTLMEAHPELFKHIM